MIFSAAWETNYSRTFYGPGGTNYLDNYPISDSITPGTKTNPKAYLRFNNHFYEAVKNYKDGNSTEAYRQLGMSLHYLADLNAPHHAANRIAYVTWHVNYETWVDENINDYLETSAAESYDYVVNRTFKAMADDWSSGARAQIDNADRSKLVVAPDGTAVMVYDSSTAGIATEICAKRAQRAAAGLLYRFLNNTFQLPA